MNNTIPHSVRLVKPFKNLHNDIRVTEVWFLKKKDKGDGVENFHYNYTNIGDGSNDVSFIFHSKREPGEVE